MGQLGFYDLDSRLKALSAKGDPLEALEALVPFESFRADIEAVVRLAPEERKSNAGRKPFDAVMMFKILVLQTLYNLADEQVEYQIRDRLSFMRFLGLGLEDVVPDATTVWLFREALSRANLVKALFDRFNGYLNAKGYIARGGQIIDATIVSAPKQHNTCEENEAIKAGKTPEGWEKKRAKNAQKDKDARWTKKNDQSFYVPPVSWTPEHLCCRSTMARKNAPYTPEFRRQMIELVRSGRSPESLSKEFEPTAQAIRNWVAQAERNAGRRDDGVTTAERDEINRLRREVKQLRLERDILSKAAAWFARETDVIPPKGSDS